MQNRLFKRLGEWAMLEDDALRISLADLGITDVLAPDRLRDARTLFARAIETPGGLKIQTIHSFCSSLLRRFPLEAGVSPLFAEMEDRAAALLREDIVADMADGAQADLVQNLARQFTGETLESLTDEIVRHRDRFETRQNTGFFLNLMGQSQTLSREDVAAKVFLGGEAELLQSFIEVLRTGGKTDNTNAEKLSNIGVPTYDDLGSLEGIFLTGASAKAPFSAKIGSVPTKALQKNHPDLVAKIDALMLRIEDDGKGLDADAIRASAIKKGLLDERDAAQLSVAQARELILKAGFSTREAVSSVSGRGVGMDVVAASVRSLGGRLVLGGETGRGTVVELILPLTLAILPTLRTACAGRSLAVPLRQIIDLQTFDADHVVGV